MVLRPAGTSTNRPKVFIGSTVEGLKAAEAIQLNLDHFAACSIWSQGVFGLGLSNIESLLMAARTHSYAVLLATSDDRTTSRGRNRYSVRDNIIFEAGLFLNQLGARRVYIITDRERPPTLPSDLDGLCISSFSMRGHGSYNTALGAASTAIKAAIEREEGLAA